MADFSNSLAKTFRFAMIAFVNKSVSDRLPDGLKKIAAIDFKTICVLYSRQEAKMHWRSRGSLRAWRYSTPWDTASYSTWTALRGSSGKRIYKECLITVEIALSLANSGLQLLLQAVLQPDRRNFYGQSHRSAPGLDLEHESEGVDTRGRVHGACANDVYQSFSYFLRYRFSIMNKRTELKPFVLRRIMDYELKICKSDSFTLFRKLANRRTNLF